MKINVRTVGATGCIAAIGGAGFLGFGLASGGPIFTPAAFLIMGVFATASALASTDETNT